jgi:type I restriction enzyme S subunit
MSGLGTYSDTKAANFAWAKNIPSHWHEYRIKHVFKIVKRIVGELGYEVLSITQKGIKVKDTTSGEGQLAMDYSKYQLAEIGDFAMNHMDLLTGFVDVSKFYGVISPDYRVFKLTHQESDSNYMLYLMQLCYTQKIFFGHGKGVSMLGRWRLPAENFKNFKIPVPPQDEQEQIAKFLDFKLAKLDRFIEKKRQLIALLNEQKTAIINNAVTKGINPGAEMKESGILWTDIIPQNYSIEGFNKKVFLKHGFQFRDNHFSEEGIKVVKISQLSPNGFLDLSNANFVPQDYLEQFKGVLINDGDILMALTGGTIGKIIRANINGESLFQNYRVGNFIPINNSLTKDYLYWQLKSEFIQSQMRFHVRETGQPNIGKSDFRKIFIVVPPINEQHEIVNHIHKELGKIDLTISKIEKEISLTEEYRTALISEAVTGKIDVRNYKIPEYKSANELATELSIAAESEPEYNGLN